MKGEREYPLYNNMTPNTPKSNFVFIFLLIISLLGGSFMVVCDIGGVEFSAYRIILGLSVIYLLLTGQLKCYTNRFSKYVFFVFLIWVLYGLASLLWTPALIYGIQELFYLGVGLTSYIVFFSFANSSGKFMDSLEKIWIVSFVIVSVFLVIELVTQRHLEGEFLQKLAGLGDFQRANFIPIFTFINQNILGIYLCISIVFAAYFLIRNRNKLLNCLIIMASIDFMFFTESRFGIICVVLLTVMSAFLLLFRNVRERIPLSFNKKHLLVLLLLIGFNVFVARLEIAFLESSSEFQFQNDENSTPVYRKLCENIEARVKEDGRILLLSDEQLKSGSQSENDMIFAIEQRAYIRLLERNQVNLVLKPISADLKRQIFMVGSKLMIWMLILLVFALVVAYIVTYRFGKMEMILLIACGMLFLVAFLPPHTFTHSSKGYKSMILAEPGFDTSNLKPTDLSVISISSVTGNFLKDGKTVRAFLYSKELVAGGGFLIPEKLGSNTIRKNLVLNGLEYLKKSHYMGLGAGGFLASNMKKMNKYPDGGVGGAHNFFIEILSQYGVIIFSLLVSVFVWIGTILFRAFKNKVWNTGHFLVLWLFVTLIFMGNANSSFLSLPINWFLLVFVLIIAGQLAESKKNSHETEQ